MGGFFSRIAVACIASAIGTQGMASPEARSLTTTMTMSELMLSLAQSVNDRYGVTVDEVSFSGSYSPSSGWSATGFVKDEDINFSFAVQGYTWELDNQNIIVTFSGTSSDHSEPLQIHGTSIIPFDAELEDYQEMDFRFAAKFGENSVWTFLFGAEIIVGLASTTVGLIPALTVSVAAKTLIDDEELEDIQDFFQGPEKMEPEMPERPEQPQDDETLTPNDGDIYIAVSPDGQISGSAFNAQYVIEGSIEGNMINGLVLSSQ